MQFSGCGSGRAQFPLNLLSRRHSALLHRLLILCSPAIARPDSIIGWRENGVNHRSCVPFLVLWCIARGPASGDLVDLSRTR